MLVTAPFAGPVSFPLLVAKSFGKGNFELKNSCETSEVGDVILDSITNVAKMRVKGYKVVAGVYIRMYSLIGNRESDVIYTLREGTLAEVNARLYAKLTNKRGVISTTPDEAVKKAKNEGKLALVGIEVEVGDIFEDELSKMGYLVPQCVIYSRSNANEVIRTYEEGIKIMSERPEDSARIISSASKYYSFETMKRIISIYSHKLTLRKDELIKSVNVYSLVRPEVRELEIN